MAYKSLILGPLLKFPDLFWLKKSFEMETFYTF